MTAKAIIIIFFLSIFSLVSTAQQPLWTSGTARVMPYKTAEISLLRPARYGITRKSEISAHPLAFFAFPHLFYKREWLKFKFLKRDILMSSRHGLYYPTIVENFIGSRNILNIYPENNSFSHALGIQNELLLGHYFQPPSHCQMGDKLLTLKTGIKYAFGTDSPYSTPALRAVLYRESMVFQPKLVSYIGIKYDAHLNDMFNYFAALDFYNIGKFEDGTIEIKLGITGYSGKHWSSFFGLKGGFTTMHTENRPYIYPVGDISYTFRAKNKRKKEMGLFGTEMFKYENQDERGEENIHYRNEDTSASEETNTKRKWLPWK